MPLALFITWSSIFMWGFAENFAQHSAWFIDSTRYNFSELNFSELCQSFKLDSLFTLSLLVPSKPIPFKQLHVSPIQSPSLSSEASTDEEVADIHARRFAGTHVEQIEQLRRWVSSFIVKFFTSVKFSQKWIGNSSNSSKSS